MNTYELKKQARIERLEKRINTLKRFAQGKDLSMFGETRSGIPLGQPILVGHHSEKRHRKHLERINRIVQSGYDAIKKVEQLESRLESINDNNSIQVDNPDAKKLIQDKIDKLTKWRNDKKTSGNYESYELTNSGTEIRRLKKRLIELVKINQGFESFTVNNIKVELIDGQIQVEFPDKPSDEIRLKLKTYPLSLKWSSYSKRWVRKHTASTGNRYRETLKNYLESII